MLSADTDYVEIWPTHLLYSNDSKEYKDGIDLIKKIFNSNADLFSKKTNDDFFNILDSKDAVEKEVYIMCFSAGGDSLTQWKHYGRGCGLAIQFNLNHNDVRFSGLSINKKENSKKKQLYPVGPFKVIYKKSEKENFIKKIIHKIYTNNKNIKDKDEKDRQMLNSLKILIGFCPLFKHESFIKEDESRLIFRPFYVNDEFKEIPKLIYYRQANGREKPFMKIRVNQREEVNEKKIIKFIRVGPGYNQDIVLDAMKHLAARRPNLIAANAIKPSDIPFRD
jgi:RecG-like helicase